MLRNPGAMAYIIAYSVHTWELFAFRSWVVAYLAFSLTRQPRDTGLVKDWLLQDGVQGKTVGTFSISSIMN